MPELEQQHRRTAAQSEEKWITSSSLLQSLESPTVGDNAPWQPPKTPEPGQRRSSGGVPSFSLSTPNGTSPRSLPSSGGSPLTPLQFMRKADEGSVVPPMTPGMHRSPHKSLVGTSGTMSPSPMPSTPSLSRLAPTPSTPSTSNTPMTPGRIWRP